MAEAAETPAAAAVMAEESQAAVAATKGCREAKAQAAAAMAQAAVAMAQVGLTQTQHP